MQDLELELYRKNALIDDKDQSITSLLRENEMLSEKVRAIESDMKIILNNRKKLDNLEEIIGRFIQKDSFDNTLSNPGEMMSTKFNSNNFNSQVLDIPERDMNRSNSNYNTKVPRWYQNLKIKESFNK